MSSAAFDDAERLAVRLEGREDLYFATRYWFLRRNGYRWMRNWHHQRIADGLMRVYRGECRRLIINLPPRYSKTLLAVVSFIAWSLGRHPDAEFIHTSYSSSLAATNALDTRELVLSDAFYEVFPDFPGLRDDSTARDDWRTRAGGSLFAVGTGGSLTGRGAGKARDEFGGAILIDDPHKPDEVASDLTRQAVIDWFQSTLESRRNSPHTPIVVIGQRLHQRDLCGWLLDGGNGEQWEHLCLPAIQPDGSALWPEKQSLEELRILEQAKPYVFAGQYQQAPAPPGGGLFKPDQIEIVEALPAGLQLVRGWDLGATRGGDPTVGAKLGVDDHGRYFIADIVRMRGAPDEVERAITGAAQRDGTSTMISLPQDPGQAGKAQVQYLVRQLAGYNVKTSPESGDKVTRAQPFASQVNIGNVKMLRAPWNEALLSEMRVFPNGAHDDQVDALSRAFSELGAAESHGLIYMRQLAKAAEAEQARFPRPPPG